MSDEFEKASSDCQQVASVEFEKASGKCRSRKGKWRVVS